MIVAPVRVPLAMTAAADVTITGGVHPAMRPDGEAGTMTTTTKEGPTGITTPHPRDTREDPVETGNMIMAAAVTVVKEKILMAAVETREIRS